MSVPAFRFQLSDFSFSWVAYCLWCAGSFRTDYAAALWHTASGLGDIDTNCAEEYAAQIARAWNARDAQRGYVTRFAVRSAFLERYPVQVVGNRGHAELWVPAEDLADLNANIVGPITVVATFEPDDGR